MTWNPSARMPRYEDDDERQAFLIGYLDGYQNQPQRDHKKYPNAYSRGYNEGKGDR